MAVPLARAIGTDIATPFATNLGERFNNNMLALMEIPDISGPTFTFSHNLPPHPPFIFDRNGNLPQKPKMEFQGDVWKDADRYIDQMRYVNSTVETTVAEILGQSPREPIIIIQGDHGPAYTGEDAASDRYVFERTGILNAFYLPEYCKAAAYKTISPVNTFRMVFDSCLGSDLGLLKDDSYRDPGGSPIDFSQISQ